MSNPLPGGDLRLARLLALCLALGASFCAQAGAASEAQAARVDARQQRQQTRIEHGVASGELTRREAQRLVHQQRHIAGLERRIESDGHVTSAEALHIERAQDRASRHIFQASHDRQARP